jgi:hypothetical protein
MPIDRHTSEDEFDRNEDIRVDDAQPQTSRSKGSKSRKVTSAAAPATDKTDKTPTSKAPTSKVPAKKRAARKTARKTAHRTAQNRPGRTARSHVYSPVTRHSPPCASSLSSMIRPACGPSGATATSRTRPICPSRITRSSTGKPSGPSMTR